ncbi:hypothetical protein [Komagataeibacter kakiaceti]|uniref:hypothetical protein n=1 Tax=Komagataeibacter kakiaceti TaxID=943261 RepID=UPI001A7E5965|nr:hypothetical protein [Komagataeibacter kakiaceti]
MSGPAGKNRGDDGGMRAGPRHHPARAVEQERHWRRPVRQGGALDMLTIRARMARPVLPFPTHGAW